jgi:hypothetical protein
MANVYAHLSWEIDTVERDASSNATYITMDKLRVQKVNYLPNAISDVITIQTYDPNTKAWQNVWSQTAAAGGSAGELSLNFGGDGHDFLGFKLAQMGPSASSDAGTLYVYFK